MPEVIIDGVEAEVHQGNMLATIYKQIICWISPRLECVAQLMPV